MNEIKSLIIKLRHSAIGYISVLFIFFTFLFMLIRFSDKTSIGVREGINLCVESLIPTLYPFMIAVELFDLIGILTKRNRIFDVLSEKLFRLPHSFEVFLLSCLGGYPVGARCIGKLVKKNAITEQEGRRMLTFTVNPSINFAVGFVGVSIFKSFKAGVLLYTSAVTSALLCGAFSGLLSKENHTFDLIFFDEKKLSFSLAFTSAVKKSAISMFYICAFTTLFSAFCSLIEIFPFSYETGVLIKCLSEVTNGVKNAYSQFSLPFIALVISFGGVCVAFQIFSELTDLNINKAKFFAVRILSSLVSYIIAYLLFKIFPVTVSAFGPATENSGVLTSHSVPVSIGLFLMTVVLIVDDILTKEKST